MKRIILLLITLLPLIGSAQVVAPPTTGGYNVSSSQVTLYRNGTGIDANLRLFGGSSYGYFDVPTFRKVYNRAQVDSIISLSVRKKFRGETTEKNLNNYVTQGVWDIYRGDNPSLWQNVPDGIDYGTLSVLRSDLGVTQFISGTPGSGPVTRRLYWRTAYASNVPPNPIILDGVPWMEITQATGTVTSVTGTNGVTSTGGTTPVIGLGNITPISSALTGTGGNGFSFFPSQSTMPATPTGGYNLFADATGRFSWKSPLGFTRTIASTALTADRVYNFADASYTVPGIELSNVFSANQSISLNGSPTLTLNNSVSGSNTLITQSPTNNEFSINVSTLPAGGIGGALGLSSASSQSVTMTNSIPTGAVPFSIGGWVQRTGGTNRYVFSNASTAAAQQIYLQINASGTYILTHSGTSFVGSPNDAPYFHFLYIFNGTQGKLFINGVISGGVQTVSSPNIGSGTLILGRSALNAQFGDFNLDQFLIYSSALTDAQAIAIYNNGLGTPSIPTTNLMRRFDFETSGTLLLDGVSGTNATATNSPAFNPNGKVAIATSGGLAPHKVLSAQNGDSNGENAVLNLGEKDFTNTVRLLGRVNLIQDVNGLSGYKGANGIWRWGYGMSLNLDANANTALYGHYWEPGNTTNIGMWQFGAATTLPAPSAAKIGVHTWDGARLDVITSATGRDKYAYLSDLTQIVEITGTSQQASANTIYIPHNTTKTVITLPLDANAPIGTLIQVVGEGSGGWRIGQNANQTIVGIGTFSTTVGTTGYVESSEANCTITLRKTLTNKWIITSSQGTINRN